MRSKLLDEQTLEVAGQYGFGVLRRDDHFDDHRYRIRGAQSIETVYAVDDSPSC
ncbi:MAG TPA: hypothetical protein VGJ62_08455 [Gemmatimonadaceae bacterium]